MDQPKLVNRIENWKFKQAYQAWIKERGFPDKEHADKELGAFMLIQALAETFGDVGWAMTGHIERIIQAAVYSLLVYLQETEHGTDK